MLYPQAVSRFVAGFAVASLLWGGAAGLYFSGVLGPRAVEPADEIQPAFGDEAATDETAATPAHRRRGRHRPGARGPLGPTPRGNATTGDALGENDPRGLDLESTGGEEQLASSEIESAMDAAFPRIRRCLVLAAGEDPVSGHLTFGMRIEPNGSVSRVNLSGPAVVSTGECGDCLRAAVRGTRFRAFDGPPMVVRYPITLE